MTNTPNTTKVEFTRWGFKHDYRGAHVTYTSGGRTILGTVTEMYYRESPPARMFKVRHFNGEDAPDVPAGVVDVLLREYEEVTP
jgi:hypothetical protein